MEAVRRSTLTWDDEMDRLWSAPSPRPDAAPPTAVLEPERTQPARRRPNQLATSGSPGWMLRLLLIASVGVLVVLLTTWAIDWARVRLDDVRYGRPRTTHLSAFVGHGDGEGVPTSLMAINLNRRIAVVEVPGGDPTRVRTIPGPYLVGKDEELTTATMRLVDVNGDGHLDLLLRVKSEELVYINDRGEFRLMTRAERPMVERALGSAQ